MLASLILKPTTSQKCTITGAKKAGQIKTASWEYNGDIKNNKANGFGIKKWTNGQRYYGEWIESHQHGPGVMIYNDSMRISFSGDWNKGQPVYGTLTYSKGDRYGAHENNVLTKYFYTSIVDTHFYEYP